MGSIPGWGRFHGGRYGSPLQYSRLENPMDKGAWQATVYSIAELDMTEATQHACTYSTAWVLPQLVYVFTCYKMFLVQGIYEKLL